jgi:hypothetical protein
MANKTVFLDPQYLDGVVDKGYVIASVRQHLGAAGALLQEDRKNATYVVEVRAGAVGTDRNELLVGVPQVNLPAVIPGVPSGALPEIPFAKRISRSGVAKIALFVFNRNTGRPVWQSGVVMRSSSAKDTTVFGAGPYATGTLYEGTHAGGEVIQVPLREGPSDSGHKPAVIPVTHAAAYVEPSDKPDLSQVGAKSAEQPPTSGPAITTIPTRP